MSVRLCLMMLIAFAANACLSPPGKSLKSDALGQDVASSDSPPRCEPTCGGMECGGDGCWGSCGTCDADDFCFYGKCLNVGSECLDPNAQNINDGCHGDRISDFQVNVKPEGDQFAPVISSFADGDFVIAWSSCPYREDPEGTSPDAQDGSACGVFLRAFGPDGKPRTTQDVPATAATTGAQFSPGMGPSNDGFVLAWNGATSGGWRTWFRLWNWNQDSSLWEASPSASDIEAALRPVDGATLVAAAAGDSQHNLVVAWEGELPEGGTGILARQFGRDQDVWDTILEDDSDFVIGAGYDDVDAPAAVGLNSELYAVLWEAVPPEDPLRPDQGSDVFGAVRRYDGQPVDSQTYSLPFPLHESWLGGQRTPAGVSDSFGDALVVAFAGTRENGILVRRFELTLPENLPETSISAQPDYDTFAPKIARLSDGRFVVVWQTDGMDDDPSGAIYARVLGTDLKGQGLPVHVNGYTFDWQERPQVAALPNNEFVVVWASCCHLDGAGWGVFAKRFNSSGEPIPFTAAQKP